MKRFEKLPHAAIGFFQALGLIGYIALVGLLMSRAENWFENTPELFAISFFLILFTTSALVSAVLTLGYPIYLFGKYKKVNESIKVVIYTIGWLALIISLLLLSV